MKRLVIGLAIIALLSAAMAQENCTCTNLPQDMTTQKDLEKLEIQYQRLLDDSASVRRLVDLQAQKLDAIMSRRWITPGELSNFSANLTETMQANKEETDIKIDAFHSSVSFKIQSMKAQSFALMMFAFFTLFALTNWRYGKYYHKIKRHLGVYPRTVPMTSREQSLKEELDRAMKLLQVQELEKEETQEEKEPSRLMKILTAILFFLIFALVIIAFLWLIGVF